MVLVANPIPTRVFAPSDEDEGGLPWLTHRGISARTIVDYLLASHRPFPSLLFFVFCVARATEGRDIFSRHHRRPYLSTWHGLHNYTDDDDNLPLLVPSNEVSYLSSHEE